MRLVLSEQFLLSLPKSGSARLSSCVQKTRSCVRDVLREGQETGELRADVDANEVRMTRSRTAATGCVIEPARSSVWRWVGGGLAVAFGLATLSEGAHVLFGGPEARAEAGNVVPFVLMSNFGAAFAYVAAGVATLAGRAWAVWLARAIAAATLLVFLAFGVHALQGGAFETRNHGGDDRAHAVWVAQSLTLPALLLPGRGKS